MGAKPVSFASVAPGGCGGMTKGAGGADGEDADGAERERSPRRGAAIGERQPAPVERSRGGAPTEAGEGRGAAIGAIPRYPPSAYVDHAEPKGEKGFGKKGNPTHPMDRIHSVLREQLQAMKLTVVEQPPPGGVLQPNEVLTTEGDVDPELEISTPGRRWAREVVRALVDLLPPYEESMGAALIAEAAGGRMRGQVGDRIKEEAAAYVDATYHGL